MDFQYYLPLLWLVSQVPCVNTIRHGQNLIWAQVPSVRMTVSRLVGIEGDPDEWVPSGSVKIRHISAPHFGWEFRALAYDYSAQTLLWSESMNKRIQSLVLNGSTDTMDVFTGTSPEVYGMAVDWLSGNLYWTDALYNWILMAPLRAEERVYKIVVQQGLDSPNGIAVHPHKGMLLWSDFGDRPRIEISDLLGGNRRILADESMEHPRGLTLDYAEDTLYWVDSGKDTVEAVRLDGTHRRLVKALPGSNFFSIASYGKYLFITEQSKGHLKIYNKTTGHNYISYRLGYIPHGLVMYDEDLQQGNSSTCDVFGCDHFCVHKPDAGPRCFCGEGYNATNGGKTCEVSKTFVQPSHIYAIHDAICHYPANMADMSLHNVTLDKQCFLDKRRGYLALTFSARDNYLYYSENNTKTISRINLEIGATAETIAGGTGVVRGLALDWVSGTLYWTDSTNQLIKVASQDGTHQADLITVNLNNPLGIAVHPQRGMLYWTDPSTSSSKVEKSYTDGSGRQAILADNLGYPNHIFIDYKTDVLYWSDSVLSHIRSYDLDSQRITVVYSQESTSFYGISYFKDFLYWTDRSEMNGIHAARMDKEEKVRGIIHPSYGIAQDLVTFDILNQPNFTSPCKKGENSCEQLCVTGRDSSVLCLCGLGYDIADDGRSCRSGVIENNFLLVTDAYQRHVFQVSGETGVIHAVQHSSRHSPIAVGFDPITMKLFWSDNTVHIIKGANLDGRFAETVVGMQETAVTDGLAVDHINRLLYYTDAGRNMIGVVSLRNYTFHKTLFRGQLDQPRAIALLPLEGVMYWSDWGVEARIEKAAMDGTGRELFLKLENNSWPNGLVIDNKKRRLYWADAHYNKIEVIFLNGTGRQLLLKEEVAHYFGLSLMGDYLYITDWKKTFISRIHKDGGSVEVFGTDSFTKLYGIYAYNATEVTRGTSVCMFQHCHHLCLPRPLSQYSCSCRDGYRLFGDGRACIRVRPMTPNTTLARSTRPPSTPSPRRSTSPNAATTSVVVTIPRTAARQTTSMMTTQSSATDTATSPTTVTVSTNSRIKPTRPSTNKGQPRVTNATVVTTRAVTSGPHVSIAPVPKSPDTDGLPPGGVAGVAVVVFVAILLAIVVAVVLYKRHENYKIPHNKLLEDDPNRVDSFYRITFPDNNKDEPVIDCGIENPAYDCVSDDEGDRCANSDSM